MGDKPANTMTGTELILELRDQVQRYTRATHPEVGLPDPVAVAKAMRRADEIATELDRRCSW
jgi:hypothetical protein